MEVLGVLLPIAVGVAFSSVPIMAMIVLLLSPRGWGVGFAYLLGYAAGLAGVTIAFSLLIRAIPRGSDPFERVAAWPEILLGVLCLGFAVWSFRRGRGVDVEQRRAPAWLTRLSGFGVIPAAAAGVVLNLRPKALVLATAAGLALNSSYLDPVSWAIDVGVYLAIGLSTVATPLVVVWRHPDRAGAVLERSRGWIERNSYIVTSVVIIMVGVVLVGDGLTRL